MRQLRNRVQPTGQDANNSIQRRDRALINLVIKEAILYIVTISLLPAVVLETTISQYMMENKSLKYLQAEIFCFECSIFTVIYLQCCTILRLYKFISIISSRFQTIDCQ